MKLSSPGLEAGLTVVSGTVGTMPHAMIKTVVCAEFCTDTCQKTRLSRGQLIILSVSRTNDS